MKNINPISPRVYVFISLLFFCAVSFLGAYDSLKTLFLFSILLVVFINLKIKNVLLSVYVVWILSFQFVIPNKYYFVQVIEPYKLLEIAYSDGYYSGYGISLSNIYSLLTIALILRVIYLTKEKKKYFELKKNIILFATAIFVISGIYSSSRFSPFAALSYTWVLQYCQPFVFALAYLTLQKIKKNVTNALTLTVICVTIIYQSIIIILQFIKQSSIGISTEITTGTSFFTGLDENNAMYRPSGTFMFHNQVSLVLAICLALISPHMIQNKSKLFIVCFYCGLTSIVLTQSRSVWLGIALAFYIFIRSNYRELLKKMGQFGIRRIVAYSLLTVLVMGPVIIPRLILSLNMVYDGAGFPIRMRLLTEGVEVLRNNFLVGYGPGTNEYMLNSFFPDGVTTVFPAPVHIGIIQLLIEVGIIGTSAFLFPFITTFIVLLKQRYIIDSEKKSAFILAVTICFVYYLFLPHVGIVEFAYIGVPLGYGLQAIRAQKI